MRAAKARSAGLLGEEYWLGTVLRWLSEFSGYLAFYLIDSWLPAHLKQIGLSTRDSSQVSSMFQFDALGGAVPFAVLVGRYNVASVVAGAFGAGSLLVTALGVSEMTPWCAGVVFLSGLTVGGPLVCVNTIPGAFYSTALRATGCGWNVAIGWLGSIIGSSLIGMVVLTGFSFRFTCVLSVIPLLIACICMTVMAPVLSSRLRMQHELGASLETLSAGDPTLANGTVR